jgi:mannosyltransferase OCH1-like enzyme
MIPKIIHIIWIGPELFPYIDNLKRYKDLHPGWKIKLWTDNNLPKLKYQKIYNAIPVYATKADLLRLEILARYGGVYVDADSYPLKPLDELIKDLDLFVTTNHKGKIEINLMGCSKKNKSVKQLLIGFGKYWKRRARKTDTHSIYCVYRYIKKKLKVIEHTKLERVYNCTAEEATAETYIIQAMDHSWGENKYFARVEK